MTSAYRSNGRRAVAWLALLGGLFVVLFWAAFFSGVAGLGEHDELVRAFEAAFPIADAVFAAALFSAGFFLLKGRRAGVFFLVAAGAMSLYLGVLDVTFYGRRGLYGVSSGAAAVELAVNFLCIAGGALALWSGWTFWAADVEEGSTRSPVRPTDRGRSRRISSSLLRPGSLDRGLGEVRAALLFALLRTEASCRGLIRLGTALRRALPARSIRGTRDFSTGPHPSWEGVASW